MSDPKVGILVNPAAGKGRVGRIAKRVIGRLSEIFPEPLIRFTERRGDGTSKARSLLDAGADVVACLGGDGTFREVAETLAGTAVPMALLPCGSGNDLARSLFGKRISLGKAIEVMKDHAEKTIDIGFARSAGISVSFASGMGIGFDALVAEGISAIRGLSGFPLYLLSTLLAFRRFRPLFLEVEAGGLTYRGPALMSGAGIGRFMGGGYMLFPKAEMNDGLLDVYVIEPVSFFKLLRNIPKVMKGTHLSMREVCYGQAESVIYRLKEESLAHTDGEVFRIGPGELRVGCLKDALRVWVPAGLRHEGFRFYRRGPEGPG